MKKCFILIDYQNDFVDLKGSLNCAEAGIAIENNIIKNVEEYLKNNDDVYFVRDYHDKEEYDNKTHPESKLFPPHCIAGTWGAELFSKVNDIKEKYNIPLLEKNSYILRFELIDEILSKNYSQIKIAGVATNICVLQNAIILYNRISELKKDTELLIAKDCIASFDEKAHFEAIDYMKNNLGLSLV